MADNLMCQHSGEVVAYFPGVGDILDTPEGTIAVDSDGTFIYRVPPWDNFKIRSRGSITTYVFNLKENPHAHR